MAINVISNVQELFIKKLTYLQTELSNKPSTNATELDNIINTVDSDMF